MARCEICNTKISEKNDGMFIRQFLSKKELDNLPVSHLCCSCKREAMFSGLMAVI
jgi:uncharacterized protein with PIN domain